MHFADRAGSMTADGGGRVDFSLTDGVLSLSNGSFGAITPEQARVHPQRNIITRAMGTESKAEPDYFEFRLGAGELLLLCSDGLSNMLTDEEILETAKEAREPEPLCRRLMEQALERGARDNVTVVAVSR